MPINEGGGVEWKHGVIPFALVVTIKFMKFGGGGLKSGEGWGAGKIVDFSLFFNTGLKGPTGTDIGARIPAALPRKKSVEIDIK